MPKAQISNRSRLALGEHGIPWSAVGDPGAGPIDPRAWFPAERRDRPLHLEIGSGKGTFLVQEAAARPGINLLGLEYARAYWRHAADRLRRHGFPGARVVHHEAGRFLACLPDRAFDAVHIYFPDPWPKKRHHKRRLIQPAFLQALHRVLADPGGPFERGRVRIATDNADYFAWMLEAAEASAAYFTRQAYAPPHSAGEGELAGTNFERKYRAAGRSFHAMILLKRQNGA